MYGCPAAIPARFYDGARTEEASAPHPLKYSTKNYRHPAREDYFYAMTDVMPASTGRTHWLTAQRIIPILRPAQILLLPGDLSRAGLNEIMAQGMPKRISRHTVRALCIYPFSLLIDFVRFSDSRLLWLCLPLPAGVSFTLAETRIQARLFLISPSMMTASARS